MEYALIILISIAVASGVTSAIVTTWSLRARTYSLEDRVAVIEGTVTREVKIRAATDRWKKPSKDESIIEAALQAQVQQPSKHVAWWENPTLKKGAYVP